MPRHSIMKKPMAFIFMTALPLAFTTVFAEARGAGVGFQSPAENTGRVGRAYSPKAAPALPSQLGDEIVAEHTQIQVQASEAESLLNDLRSQLAAQPDARLSIRWQLTRPAGIK